MTARRLVIALTAVALVAAGCGQRAGAHTSAASAEVGLSAPSAATDLPSEPVPASAPAVDARANEAAVAQAPVVPTAAPAPVERSEPTSATRQPVDLPTEQRTAFTAKPPPDPGTALWNRTFASVRVTEDRARRPLAPGTRLRINPAVDRGTRLLRYGGSCNTGGASLRITSDRFVVADDGAMSSASCGAERDAQESWYVAFLHTSPSWRLSQDGTRLTLTSGDTVVVFEEHPWPPWSDT